MISTAKIIGQEVISLVSKKIIGNVKCFSIKNNKLDLVFCFSDNDEIEFSFPSKNILSFGDDALVIKSEDGLSVSENISSDSFLGLPVINQKGKKLGLVKDVEVNDNLKIENIVLQNKKISGNEIDILDSKFILLKGKYKVKNKKIIKNNFNYLVNIQNEKIVPENLNLPKITDEISETKIATPQKKIASPPSLIGKTIVKDVYYKNKIIIKSGTIISQKVLDLALLAGLTKEISLNCI